MPIEKISAAQFADDLRAGILSRDDSFEVTVGEIPDLCINPQARVFERQNDRLRKLSLIITMSNPDEFEGEFESDLDGIVFNEGMRRSLGAQSTATLTFSRAAAPTTDVPVQRGYPVATQPDEGTGQTVTFVATEERRLLAASASSFFDIETQRYVLQVPVVATIEGASGVVGANRINRALRPLLGFDSVANTVGSSGGRERETNTELIDRYLIAILGRRLATSTGVEKVVEDDFPEVIDTLVVAGTNPLLTRADDDAGAVDVYVIGEQRVEATENPEFFGAGQLIQLTLPPIVEAISVQDLAAGTTYIEDDDYTVELDTTGRAASARAVEGIRFSFTGTNALPTVGAPVTITYSYNNLIRRLQVELDQDDKTVHGRDLLMKQGTEVPMAHEAQLRVESGFNTTTVLAAVSNAVLNFFNNTLGLGADDGFVEGSDIQGVVRQISGVDNYIITRLTRTTVSAGTADVAIADNEYPTLSSADLVITLI